MPIAYLLLHDNAKGDADRAKSVYEKMMSKFGTNHCFFLPINSNESAKAATATPWDTHVLFQTASSGESGKEASRMASVSSLHSFHSADFRAMDPKLSTSQLPQIPTPDFKSSLTDLSNQSLDPTPPPPMAPSTPIMLGALSPGAFLSEADVGR